MINKALKYLANNHTIGEFFNQFEHEAYPLLEGLESKGYIEQVFDTNGKGYLQLTLEGTKALLDSEGLDYNA